MRGVEILLVVSVVMQLVAMVIATLLVKRTKYSALGLCCILGLIMLSVERVYQLKVFSGGEVSDMAFAWVGIIVSLSSSALQKLVIWTVPLPSRIFSRYSTLHSSAFLIMMQTSLCK